MNTTPARTARALALLGALLLPAGAALAADPPAASQTLATIRARGSVAAASARQEDTSSPRQVPWLSGWAKPARPVLTPHTSVPRDLIASSVAAPCGAWAEAEWRPSANSAVAARRQELASRKGCMN